MFNSYYINALCGYYRSPCHTSRLFVIRIITTGLCYRQPTLKFGNHVPKPLDKNGILLYNIIKIRTQNTSPGQDRKLLDTTGTTTRTDCREAKAKVEGRDSGRQTARLMSSRERNPEEGIMNDIDSKTNGFGIGEAGQASASTPEDELEAARLQPWPAPDYPDGRKLSCGCTVYRKVEVMSASLGSSCFNCYDRMSDA